MNSIEAKLLDIIIPVYNKQEFLFDLINSLATLCEKRVNVIFVDDGSTDQSLMILKSNSIDNFFIYGKENGGVSSARNYGLRQSKSKYIWFFDPDDQVGPDILKVIYQLENHKEDILVFNYNKKIIKYNLSEYFTFEKYGLLSTHDFSAKYNYFTEKNNMSFIWNKFYKSEFIKNIFFNENLTLSEDRRFNLEVFSRNGNVRIIDNCLYIYFIYDGGTLSTSRDLEKVEYVYETNLINIEYLQRKREYVKKHVIEQIIFRAKFGSNNLYEFYIQEHRNFEIKIFPFLSFKELIIFILLFIGGVKIAIRIQIFFKKIILNLKYFF